MSPRIRHPAAPRVACHHGFYDAPNIGAKRRCSSGLDRPSRPTHLQYSCCVFSEIVIYFAHPVPQRGRFAVVTDVGCGMRWACRVAARVSRADERSRCDGEVAWFWHPGADAKSAMMLVHRRKRRGQDSRSPGRARINRNTIAQGGSGVSRPNLWYLPPAFFVAGGPWERPAPDLPCALCHQEGDQSRTNSGAMRRENKSACLVE